MFFEPPASAFALTRASPHAPCIWRACCSLNRTAKSNPIFPAYTDHFASFLSGGARTDLEVTPQARTAIEKFNYSRSRHHPLLVKFDFHLVLSILELNIQFNVIGRPLSSGQIGLEIRAAILGFAVVHFEALLDQEIAIVIEDFL